MLPSGVSTCEDIYKYHAIFLAADKVDKCTEHAYLIHIMSKEVFDYAANSELTGLSGVDLGLHEQ